MEAVLLAAVALGTAHKCNRMSNTSMICLEANDSDFPTTIQPFVEVLNLEACNITRLDFERMSLFPNLRSIIANDGALEVFEPVSPELNVVQVQNNNLRGFGTTRLRRYNRLVSMTVANNPIDIRENEAVMASPTIINLNLNNCRVRRVYYITFSQLPTLRSLHLGGNLLETLPNGAFKHQKRLHTLNLANNKFHHLSPLVFQGMPELAKLYLDGNRWECDYDLLKLAEMMKNFIKDRAPCQSPAEIFNETTSVRTRGKEC